MPAVNSQYRVLIRALSAFQSQCQIRSASGNRRPERNAEPLGPDVTRFAHSPVPCPRTPTLATPGKGPVRSGPPRSPQQLPPLERNTKDSFSPNGSSPFPTRRGQNSTDTLHTGVLGVVRVLVYGGTEGPRCSEGSVYWRYPAKCG